MLHNRCFAPCNNRRNTCIARWRWMHIKCDCYKSWQSTYMLASIEAILGGFCLVTRIVMTENKTMPYKLLNKNINKDWKLSELCLKWFAVFVVKRPSTLSLMTQVYRWGLSNTHHLFKSWNGRLKWCNSYDSYELSSGECDTLQWNNIK